MPSFTDTEKLFSDTFEEELKRRQKFDVYNRHARTMGDADRFRANTARSLALSDVGYRSSDIRSGAAKNHFIKSNGIKLPEGYTDQDFDSALQTHIKAKADDERLMQEVFTQQLDEAFNSDESNTFYAYVDPKRRGMAQQARAAIDKFSPPVKRTLQILSEVSQDGSFYFTESGNTDSDGDGVSDLATLQEAWITMTPEEQGQVEMFAPIMMKSAIDRAPDAQRGFFPGMEKGIQGIFEGFGQTVFNRGRDIRNAQGNDKMGTEQHQQEQRLYGMLQQYRDAFQNKETDDGSYDWAGMREILGGSAAEMGAAAASIPFLAISKAGEFETRDVFENPYASNTSRMLRGTTSGFIEAGLSKAQFKLLKIKGSAVASLLGEGAKRNAVGRFTGKLAGTMAGETIIEGFQEFTPEMVNQISRNMGVPGVNPPQFEEKFNALVEELPEMAGAFLIMSAISAGGDVTLEMRNSKILGWQTKSSEVMEMMGLAQDRAIEIAGIENDVDRVNAYIEAAHEHAKAVEAGKAEAAPVITPDMADGARRAVMEQMGEEAQNSTAPVFVPMPDGTIDVQLPTGEAINVDSPEQAFTTAQAHIERTVEARREALELLQSEEGKSFIDTLTDLEKERLKDSMPGLEQIEQEQRSLREEVDAGRIKPDVAARRIRDLAFQQASQLEAQGKAIDPEVLAEQLVASFTQGETDFNISGEAIGATARVEQGLLQAAIKLDPNKDFRTLWEEASEAHMHGMLNSGLITEFELENMLLEVEEQTGKKFVSGSSRENLIEGFSFLAKAYAAGDLKNQTFTGKLKTLMDALIATLMDVVGMAKEIDQLRKDGNLNADLEANIRAGLGMDNGVLYAQAVTKAQNAQGASSTPTDNTQSINMRQGVAIAKAEKVRETKKKKFWGKIWPNILKLTGDTDPKTGPGMRRAVNAAIDDMMPFIDSNPDFLGYYAEDWDATREVLEARYQGLTDDDFAFYRFLVGIMSPSTPLKKNILESMSAFDHYMGGGDYRDAAKIFRNPRTNQMKGISNELNPQGATWVNKARNIIDVIEFKEKTGKSWVEFQTWMGQRSTYKDMAKLRKEMGYAGNPISEIQMATLLIPSGEIEIGATESSAKAAVREYARGGNTYPNGLMFGKKVGAYTLNSMGYPQYSTVDIWESRLIRSYLGMFKRGGSLDLPAASEDLTMARFVKEFQSEFRKRFPGVRADIADLQALRWFFMIEMSNAAGFKRSEVESISSYTDLMSKTMGSEGYRALATGEGDGSAIPATIEPESSYHIEESAKSVPAAVEAANSYVARYGDEFGIEDPGEIKGITTNVEQSKKFGIAYEALPEVDEAAAESYAQLVEEIEAQYRWLTENHGVRFTHSEEDGYNDSDEMRADVRENKHMTVYKGGDDHPFLGSKTMDDQGLTANDKFRAVHDYFGHAAPGTSFGPVGEERAWYAHSRMFSPLARKAMSAETRGQNSWVNYGPHMWNESGWRGDKSNPDYIHPKDRPFAEQKSAIFPEEVGITSFDTIHVRRDGKVAPASTFEITEKRPPNYKATKVQKGPTPVHHDRLVVDGLQDDEIVHFTGFHTGPISHVKVQKAGNKGAERKVYRDYPEIYTNRAYFARNGYAVEEQYGIEADKGYKIKVHESNWYPEDDPLQLRDLAKTKAMQLGYPEFDSTARNEIYLGLIRDHGYAGFRNETVGVLVRDLPLDGLPARSATAEDIQAKGWVKPARAKSDSVVWIDVAKFDAAWQRDSGFRVGPGGEKGIGNRYENFGRWVNDSEGEIEMAEVSVGPDGIPGFTNGRHRVAYSRDMGVKQLPIAVDRGSVKRMTELFGVEEDVANTMEISQADGFHSRFTDQGTQYWKTYGGKAFIEVTVPFGGTAVNVDNIMADPSTMSGTDILKELRMKFPDYTLHVHGAVESAVGFYEKMQDRGIIDSWTRTDAMKTFSIETLSIDPETQKLYDKVVKRLENAPEDQSEEVYLRMVLNIERMIQRQKSRKAKEAFAKTKVLRVPNEVVGSIIAGEIDGWTDAQGNQHTVTPAQLAELKRMDRKGEITGRGKFVTVRTFTDVDPERDRAMLQDLAAYDAMLSALPPEVRGKMGGFTRLAGLPTHEARIKYLDERLDAIESHLDRHLGNKFQKDIREMMKINKVKVVNGIPQGKGAKFHEDLTRIDGILDMDRDEVMKKNTELELALSGTQDPDQIQRLTDELVELITFGNIMLKGENRRNARDIYQAREELGNIIGTGKARWKAMQEARANQNRENQEELVQDITGGSGLKSQSQAKRDKPGKVRDRAQEFANKSNSWEWMLNRATKDSGERALQNRTVKKWGRAIHIATHAERRRNWKETEEMSRALAAVFGITTKGNWRFRLSKRLESFREEQETGVSKLEFMASESQVEIDLAKAEQILAGEASPEAFGINNEDLDLLQTLVDEQRNRRRPKKSVFIQKRTAGPMHELRLSKDQAVYLTMLWRQEGAQRAMKHWGWTEETIQGLDEFIGQEGRAVREYLRAKYDQNWFDLNEVYARRFGINMPRIKNYSPARYIHDGKVEDAEMLLDETIPGASVTPGFAKMRINHAAQPREDVGALQVYAEHMRQSSHFIAWADTIAEARAAFLHKDVQTAIEQRGGRWLKSMINERLEFMADGGNRVKSVWVLDALRKRFTVLALAYNWGVMVKQFTSQPAFLFDMETGTFLKYQAKFFANPVENWKKIASKDFVKERMSTGFDRDVQLVLNSFNNKSRGAITAALEFGMITGRAGDIVPVIVGGWVRYQSVYDAAISRGANATVADQEATLAMEMSVERAQQSGDVKDLSHFQQGGSPARLFTMFLTSPLQYYMNTYNAIHNVKAPGGKQDLIKRIIVSHILLPFAFQFTSDLVRNVKNLTDDDEETGLLDLNPLDYARAMLLGPLNGLFVVGHGLSSVSGYTINALYELLVGFDEEKGPKRVKVWGYKSPVVELVEDTGKGLKGGVEGFNDLMEDPSLDDFGKIANGIGEAVKLTPGGGAYDVGKRIVKSVGLDDEFTDSIRPTDEKLADRLKAAKTRIYALDKAERAELGKVKKTDPMAYAEARTRIREIDRMRYEELASIIISELKPFSNEEIREALENLPENFLPADVKALAFPDLDFVPTTQ